MYITLHKDLKCLSCKGETAASTLGSRPSPETASYRNWGCRYLWGPTWQDKSRNWEQHPNMRRYSLTQFSSMWHYQVTSALERERETTIAVYSSKRTMHPYVSIAEPKLEIRALQRLKQQKKTFGTSQGHDGRASQKQESIGRKPGYIASWVRYGGACTKDSWGHRSHVLLCKAAAGQEKWPPQNSLLLCESLRGSTNTAWLSFGQAV